MGCEGSTCLVSLFPSCHSYQYEQIYRFLNLFWPFSLLTRHIVPSLSFTLFLFQPFLMNLYYRFFILHFYIFLLSLTFTFFSLCLTQHIVPNLIFTILSLSSTFLLTNYTDSSFCIFSLHSSLTFSLLTNLTYSSFHVHPSPCLVSFSSSLFITDKPQTSPDIIFPLCLTFSFTSIIKISLYSLFHLSVLPITLLSFLLCPFLSLLMLN